jgi:GrpB-like predicted nucleotidyltransferase (UPF0157 family)
LPGHRLWQGIKFRDYLINNPAAEQEYLNLKMRLANLYKNDREEYTNAKGDFIKKCLIRAERS